MLKDLIQKHYKETKSKVSEKILQNFENQNSLRLVSHKVEQIFIQSENLSDICIIFCNSIVSF